MSKPHPTRTLDHFLADLESANKTVASWARERQLPLGDVYAFIAGRTTGKRGKARDIAIAMGLKPPAMHRPAAPIPRANVRPRVARAIA